jgi:hypothetical protein
MPANGLPGLSAVVPEGNRKKPVSFMVRFFSVAINN